MQATLPRFIASDKGSPSTDECALPCEIVQHILGFAHPSVLFAAAMASHWLRSISLKVKQHRLVSQGRAEPSAWRLPTADPFALPRVVWRAASNQSDSDKSNISKTCPRRSKAPAGLCFVGRGSQSGRLLAVPCSEWAARNGHLDWLRWAVGTAQCTLTARTMAQAAAGGHRHIVEWLESVGCPVDALATAAAMQGGHVGLLHWMRTDERCDTYPWDGRVSCFAALRGDLPTLIWLQRQGAPWYGPQVVAAAAFGGHAALTQWLLANKCCWDDSLPRAAGTSGNIALIAMLTSHRLFKCTSWFRSLLIESAARHCRLDAVAFLLERFNFAMHTRFCMGAAATAGHLAVMELFWRQGGLLASEPRQGWFNLLECGARSGNVNVAKWVCERMDISLWKRNPCVMAAAARSGSIEMLAYLAAQGCVWDVTAQITAATLDDPRVLAWFNFHEC